MVPLSRSFLVLVALSAMVPDARALDPNSLRLVKISPATVGMSWQDPDPTVFCIARDAADPVITLLDQSTTLTYQDTPPAAAVWFYSVDEPASGTCVSTTCTAAGSIGCGTAMSARNDDAGSTNSVLTWPGCAVFDASGPELATSFTAPEDGDYVVTMSNAAPGLELFVVRDQGAGCSPAGCIASALSVPFTATAGETWYFIVDGRAAAIGSFDLTVSCPPPVGSTCVPVGSLGCGDFDTRATSGAGATSLLADHAGCFANGYSAPEIVYTFSSPQDDTVTFTLSGMTADLDVLVLDGAGGDCETSPCVAVGDNTVTFAAVAGRSYFVVVDGQAGQSGSFRIDGSCPSAECLPDATLLCGQVVAYSNAWPIFSDVNDSYPCTGFDESGPEYTYSFTATANGNATATLSNLAEDLDVLVLDGAMGCTAQSCIAFGDTSVNFSIQAGHEYHVVVDGRDAASGFFRLDLACAVPPSPCQAAATMRCGEVTGNNSGAPGSTDTIDSWTCSPGIDFSGPEYSFQFSSQDDATVHVLMELNTEDLDLFVLQEQGNGCQPADCIASGDQDLTFNALAGSVYYVVVDGRNGVRSDFRLWADCQSVSGPCRAARAITCGESVNGNNGQPGSTDAIDVYAGCLPYPEEGPEFTYEFLATSTGTLTATLSGMSGDNDVFVLHDTGRGCNDLDCIAARNISVDVPVTAGETYYIVVDGFAGSIGDYTLSVSCS